MLAGIFTTLLLCICTDVGDIYLGYKEEHSHSPDPLSHKVDLLSQVELVPSKFNYNQVTSRSCNCGNLSHDPTCDPLCDPSATMTLCDLTTHDPGKITHDLSRNWSLTRSHDKMHFGHVPSLLINIWKIMGTINKTCPLNDQQRCNVTQSMETQLIGARPQSRHMI